MRNVRRGLSQIAGPTGSARQASSLTWRAGAAGNGGHGVKEEKRERANGYARGEGECARGRCGARRVSRGSSDVWDGHTEAARARSEVCGGGGEEAHARTERGNGGEAQACLPLPCARRPLPLFILSTPARPAPHPAATWASTHAHSTTECRDLLLHETKSRNSRPLGRPGRQKKETEHLFASVLSLSLSFSGQERPRPRPPGPATAATARPPPPVSRVGYCLS